MYTLTDEDLATADPEVLVWAMLSREAFMPAPLTLAEEYTKHEPDDGTGIGKAHFDSIGGGGAGAVFAISGTATVVKVPLQATAHARDLLFAEAKTHLHIMDAFDKVVPSLDGRYVPKILISRLRAWVSPVTDAEPFWPAEGWGFGKYGIVSDRIFPLPAPIRMALCEALHWSVPGATVPLPTVRTATQKKQFINRPENENCLVHVFLGRRDAPVRSWLLDFPLFLAEMEMLGLPVLTYAAIMARALAILHWVARVDGLGVKFVLGCEPETSESPGAAALRAAADPVGAQALFRLNVHRRSVGLWMLSFEGCSAFRLDDDDEAGGKLSRAALEQLIAGFWGWEAAGPYYPRPDWRTAQERELWECFREVYLDASDQFCRPADNPHNPRIFLDALEAQGAAGALWF